MKYRVHINAIVRIPVEVEASSMGAAIIRAEEDTDLYKACREGAEWSEDIDCFLVDELDAKGEVVPGNSIWFDKDGVPL